MTVIYPIPEDNVPRIVKRAQSGEASRRRCVRSQRQEQARDRQAADLRQPDRHDDGHRQAQGGISQPGRRAFPEPVRQRAHGGRDSPGRHAGSERGDPARRSRHLRLPRQAGSNRVGRAGQAGHRAEGETTEIASGIEPGSQVVVDGADKLREGSKIELIDPHRRARRTDDPSKRAASRANRRTAKTGRAAVPKTAAADSRAARCANLSEHDER